MRKLERFLSLQRSLNLPFEKISFTESSNGSWPNEDKELLLPRLGLKFVEEEENRGGKKAQEELEREPFVHLIGEEEVMIPFDAIWNKETMF